MSLLREQLSALDPGEAKRVAEQELCRLDRRHWIRNHFWIKDRDTGALGRLDPLRPSQEKLLSLIHWCRSRQRPVRIIILKARKTGISTLCEADLFCDVLQHGIDAIVIAHDKSTAEYIFGITKRFYEHYDLPKPDLGRANKGEIKFEGREGYIIVETANNIQAGTGRTPQFIHISECAKYERGTETATALFQSIGDGPGTTVIIESTAYGYDDLFYPMWQKASQNCQVHFTKSADSTYSVDVDITNPEEWNGYIPYFISWMDEPAYSRPFQSEQDKFNFIKTLDDAEAHLFQSGTTPEQLNWRRWTFKEKCRSDIKVLRQEYPSTDIESFVSSGRPRLDHDVLDTMPVESGIRGVLIREDSWARIPRFQADKNEFMIKFRNPVRGHRYTIGVDVAEGIMYASQADESAVCVLDIDNGGEQVCAYGGCLSEEHIVWPIALIGEFYNSAFLVVETNSTGKHTAIELAKIYPPERLYHRTDWDEGRARRGRTLGWRTHVGSRPILISSLARAIGDRAVTLRHRKTIEQCKRLVYTSGGRVEADRGEHDDWPFSLALAIVGMQNYPYEAPSISTDAAEPPWKRTIYLPDEDSPREGDAVTGY